ncbi:unnamed protein product [Caenorhabditis sp. 36 PRJEB53466]|nr:unnamed protein product [Caenorhabditis sp. 36 PRJEB53466]
MRVFVLLRSLFFLVLLTAISIFIAHRRLCINYAPHDLEGIMERCSGSLHTISQVNPAPLNDTNAANASVDTAHRRFKRNSSAEEELIEQWRRLPHDTESIRLNVRTCFDFSINDILTDSVKKYSTIVSPLRLTLILVVTSFLLAVIDLSSRIIIHDVSIIQCLAHSFVQVSLWGYTLVNMEMYRRSWTQTWLETEIDKSDVPMYPIEWMAFELHAFIIIMLSILDVVLFKFLPLRIRLLNSQGVYRCIQTDAKYKNKDLPE